MHDLFPDWLRTATPDNDISSFPINEWWEVIESYAQSATADEIFGLLKCGYGRAEPDWEENWRHAFREGDDTFPLRDSDRLVSVLAASAVIHLRESGADSRAALALYGCVCAQHVDWTAGLSDLTVAPTLITRLATEARQQTPWRSAKTTVTATSYESTLPPDEETVTGASLRGAVASLVGGVNDALSRAHRTVGQIAEQRELPLREEVRSLRWLLSGYCATVGRAWSSLGSTDVAVLAALELDGLTVFPMGIPDAAGLLAQTVELAGQGDRVEIRLPNQTEISELVPMLAGSRAKWNDVDNAARLSARLYDELRLLHNYRVADQ
jgi:hypothetical protein